MHVVRGASTLNFLVRSILGQDFFLIACQPTVQCQVSIKRLVLHISHHSVKINNSYYLTMKAVAFLFTFLAVASAFAPMTPNGRASTELKKSFFDTVCLRYVASDK
jgi:hypothetical protein